MPKKSAIIDKKNVRVIETYSVNVTCPYCGNTDLVEEDYGEPEDHTCYKCNKHFLIKYVDEKKSESKPKKLK